MAPIRTHFALKENFSLLVEILHSGLQRIQQFKT